MHSQALSRITMRLMQGYENKSGAVGIEVVNRWPLDSLAFKFLEETNKSKTAAELLKVREQTQLRNIVLISS